MVPWVAAYFGRANIYCGLSATNPNLPSLFTLNEGPSQASRGYSLVRDRSLKGDLRRLTSKGWEVTASSFLVGSEVQGWEPGQHRALTGQGSGGAERWGVDTGLPLQEGGKMMRLLSLENLCSQHSLFKPHSMSWLSTCPGE